MSVVATALALALWLATVIVLARRAEAPCASAAVPWRAGAACAAIVGAIATVRPPLGGLACGIACVALVVAAFADARTGYLFDAVTFPAAAVTAIVAVATGNGASAAAGVCVLVVIFGTLVTLSRGRMMGLGDVKAMYALGAAFGPAEAVFAVFAACISGIATAFVVGRFRRGAEVRFGPHLAAGGTLALVFGDPLVHGALGL